ncbi:hypothetical protein SAMN05444285_1166 [Draconibacterium orientale]|uniref:Uncharacterized protein n=1 Tax=Draconibacterium orientale TaxID=1168034 RepID=X5E4C5_9BACT|nr:hypothetical protein [Draconibacterium orientale]AHW62305.1 hypothetical protein FH5T_19295 [Draconibacterium orientale]SET54673.1 hypothetical protein SAMN05444285_1166 [Draconibacterium orientale]
MEKIVFTRKELYELVWSEPLSRLARKYNISDNGIRKRCKKMNIPLPKAGHWSKIQHGYKVIVPKLPGKYEGENETILCYRDKDGNYVEKVDVVTPQTKLKHELQNDPQLPLTVPEKITRFDSLIAQAKKSLQKKSSGVYNYEGMRATERGEINIMVSESNIDRALYFMNTLIKLFRARKHNIIIEDNETYAVIFGEKLPIKFKEKAKISYETSTYGWRSRTYHPSGKLAFVHDNRPYNQKEWLDGKKPLESRLAEILAYFETYAKKEIEDRIEWEKRRKIEEEEQKRQQELQIKKNDEIRRIKVLINMANYWKQAQILRDYITALENTNGLDFKKMDWIPWAKQKFEWFDPFTQGPDEILDDDDRQELMEELNKKVPRSNSYW